MMAFAMVEIAINNPQFEAFLQRMSAMPATISADRADG
jgi:hypothetical protein